MIDYDKYFTAKQAARFLGLSSTRIRQLCYENRLRFINTPLGRLIAIASLKEYASIRQPAGRPRGYMPHNVEVRG